jgi:uncharacterized membrane protein
MGRVSPVIQVLVFVITITAVIIAVFMNARKEKKSHAD